MLSYGAVFHSKIGIEIGSKMATIKERKDKNGKTRFQVIIRRKGYPTQTATFLRKTDARKWEQDIESAIRDGRHFKTSKAKKHTLSEMIDRYLSQQQVSKCKKAQLDWWKEALGSYLIADISPSHIAEKRDELLRTSTPRGSIRCPATVCRYLAALSLVFTIGIKEFDWAETNPVRNVTKPKEPAGRVRFLDDQERTHLLETCQKSSNPYLYCVVVLAISTGMRQGEIMNLKWSNVDLFRKQIILEKTKNGTRRMVPIVRLAYDLLKDLSNGRNKATDLLFPGKKINKPIELRKPWINALKEAHIKDFRFHDLRHTAASYLAMNGASLAEIGTLLGHLHIEVTRRYSHLSDNHMLKIVDSMNESIFG